MILLIDILLVLVYLILCILLYDVYKKVNLLIKAKKKCLEPDISHKQLKNISMRLLKLEQKINDTQSECSFDLPSFPQYTKKEILEKHNKYNTDVIKSPSPPAEDSIDVIKPDDPRLK